MLSTSVISSGWKMMIKPERQSYAMDNLGGLVIPFEHYNLYRVDFSFENSRGSKIPCSVFIPIKNTIDDPTPEQMVLNRPCVIYSHSQSGNRIEGLFLLDFCGTNGYGLCVYDFHACGRAPGTYVTLGWKEQEDLGQVVKLITRDYKATQIALWGRSMGAVTTIFYSQKHSNLISAVVLDSPFSDMSAVIQDVAYEQMGLPNFLVNMSMGFFSNIIKKKVHYDVITLKPVDACRECTVPVVFIMAKKDKMVAPKRIKQMYELWGCKEKAIVESEGEHASEREPHVIEQGFVHIQKYFQKNATNYFKPVQAKNDFNIFRKAPDNYLQSLSFTFDQKLRNSSNKIITGDNIYMKKTQPINFEVAIDGDLPPHNPIPFETDVDDYASDAYDEAGFESQIGGDQYNIAGQLDALMNNIKVTTNNSNTHGSRISGYNY